MSRKRAIILTIVVLVLAGLVYLQVREWRHFDWQKFEAGSQGINWLGVLYAVLLVYVADFLRAIRWKIFLRPTVPNASWTGLIAPQYVGFAGIALLGRPGELIRPYLIAKRTKSTLSAQMAIWFVERAFDTAGVTVIVVVDMFTVSYIREGYPGMRIFGYALIGLCIGFIILLWAVWTHGESIARWACGKLSLVSPQAGTSIEHKIRSLSTGLNTFHSIFSFLQCTAISVVIWMLIAYAYRAILNSYPETTGLPGLDLPEAILLMGASVAGGVITLPVIGGGSQLATISVLVQHFGFEPEVAVSCGMLCWLVTFMAVTPLGLLLARHEHVSIRKLTAESQAAEKADERAGALS